MLHNIKGHDFYLHNNQNHKQWTNDLAQRRKGRESVLIDFWEVLVALFETYFNFSGVGFGKNLWWVVVTALLPDFVPFDECKLLELVFHRGLLPFDSCLDFAFAAEDRFGHWVALFGLVFGDDFVLLVVRFLLEGLFTRQRSWYHWEGYSFMVGTSVRVWL